jgi:Ca-activated chloride channel family protein
MTFNPVLPWWLMAALAAVLALGVGTALVRARPARARPGGARPAVARSAGARSDKAEFHGWLFRGGLVLLLLLAAARPGIPGGTVPAAASELDVFFVVDTSSSIVAEDYSAAGKQDGGKQDGGKQDGGKQGAGEHSARLDGVRQDIRTIAEELAGARYSLITFDSGSVVRMPLTADTSALDTVVSVLGPQITSYSQGSSVTAAGAVLAERLAAARDRHPERPRLVFYFGDGEQTSATAPRALGVDSSLVSGGAVLGYGTAEGGKMKINSGDPARPAADYIAEPGGGGEAAVSRIDEQKLQEIARGLAVPYVHRAAGDAAAPMLQKAWPGTLERTGDSLEGRTELYWVPALAAFLLALRETLLVFRQLQELRPVRSPSRAAAPIAAEEADG